MRVTGAFLDNPDLFEHIQIETIQGCTRKCKFCPNKYIPRTGELLPMETIVKVVMELKSLGFKGTVYPYLSNEPFLDERLPAIISFIQDELPDCRIKIDSNGDVLSIELAEELIKRGIDLTISAYDERINQKFGSTEIPTAKKYGIDSMLTDLLYNRGGNIYGTPPTPGFCERPFNQMYIRYTGEAVLCCSDFLGVAVMGDVSKESLLDIWRNKKYEEYRTHLILGDRNLPLCALCNYQSPAEKEGG